MIILLIWIFWFGLLIGSFLNVVIHRVPLNQSVVTPRSKCPSCGHQIKWYENIPVVSYIFLKGKCSQCKSKISIRYPLIELFTGLMACYLFPTFITQQSIILFVCEFAIACIFLAHFFIDIEYQLLPDKLNLYLLAIVFGYSFMINDIVTMLLGALIGFGGTYLITYIFYKLRGQIGLGGGDIKLFGILGLLLGPQGIVELIFMSSLMGSVFGIILIFTGKMNKNKPLAFGPYILIIASVQIFLPSIFKYINIYNIY